MVLYTPLACNEFGFKRRGYATSNNNADCSCQMASCDFLQLMLSNSLTLLRTLNCIGAVPRILESTPLVALALASSRSTTRSSCFVRTQATMASNPQVRVQTCSSTEWGMSSPLDYRATSLAGRARTRTVSFKTSGSRTSSSCNAECRHRRISQLYRRSIQASSQFLQRSNLQRWQVSA